ncbi:right-handed parallel beta-helix repeat-containing protein [Streptomyces diacarni]|uniref:right-handed parallel beta-helix repeat-containing protein n=1 Tax=Streptomyces diacarni TaxID=2800381 RepID=UPI0033D5A511
METRADGPRNNRTPGPGRRALAGVVGATAAGVLLSSREAAAAPASLAAASARPSLRDTASSGNGADTADSALPVLRPGDDWQQTLARTSRVQLVPGATYTLSSAVELPDACLIVGNGATVTVTGASMGALRATRKRDITLTGIHFRGQDADPLGSAMAADHVAVALTRASDVRVTGCDFTHWRGAGLVVTGSASDDFVASRTLISGNTFDRCYFGASTADRSEYAVLADNVFTHCRLALWNSSGNWNIHGNTVVGCYGAYYSLAATSPYGRQSDDNWNHGALTGNTLNHANGGTSPRWTANAAFPLDGSSRDPGPGVVVSGLLPPTFSGNTLWYTDLTATDLQGSGWVLSGCALSDLTVRCSGSAPVHLVGHQGNHPPTLEGNVTDVLAGASGRSPSATG